MAAKPKSPEEAMEIINDLLTCMKHGKGPNKLATFYTRSTGKMRVVTLQDSIDVAFKAITGKDPKKWLAVHTEKRAAKDG